MDIYTVLDEVREALAQGDWGRATRLVEDLRPPDQADLFSDLPPDDQDALIPRLELEDSADILEELEEEEAAQIATRLEPEALAHLLDEMEPDEAADLLGDLAPDQAMRALAVMEDAEEIRPLLIHPDETAGGQMTSATITLHQNMTVEQAIAHLRSITPDFEESYYLFVVDEDIRLVGVVPLRDLVIASPQTLIRDVMDPEVISVDASADQEEAARLMARYDLLALPVIDERDHLLGLITHDDLVDVLEEEATEDIYRLGGVPEEQPVDVPIPVALRARLPWLVLNLVTALASAVVLNLFQGTIAQVAILAAFFPIVAGVSGSAGTQALTVTVRGIALGELDVRTGLHNLSRESLIGLANGAAIGILVAFVALGWHGTPVLGVVVGAATLLNMIAAGLAGALVPLAMLALNIDPALGSPILVTTITDALGYFIYLGLATILITQLL